MQIVKRLANQITAHYNPADYALNKELHYTRIPYCSNTNDSFCDLLFSHISTMSGSNGFVLKHSLLANLTGFSRYKVRRALIKMVKSEAINIDKKVVTVINSVHKNTVTNSQQIRHSPVIAQMLGSIDAAELVGHLSFVAERRKHDIIKTTDEKLCQELNWTPKKLHQAKLACNKAALLSWFKSARFTTYKVNIAGIKTAIDENKMGFESSLACISRSDLYYLNNLNALPSDPEMCDMAQQNVRYGVSIYKAYTSTTISNCLSDNLERHQVPEITNMQKPELVQQLPQLGSSLPQLRCAEPQFTHELAGLNKPKTKLPALKDADPIPKTPIPMAEPISQLLNEFSIFANSYPKARRGNKFFFQAFVKARRDASLQELLEGLKRDSEQRAAIKARRGFAPALLDGENWLKKERWKDSAGKASVIDLKSYPQRYPNIPKSIQGGVMMRYEPQPIPDGSKKDLENTKKLVAATDRSFEIYMEEILKLQESGASFDEIREFQLKYHPHLGKEEIKRTETPIKPVAGKDKIGYIGRAALMHRLMNKRPEDRINDFGF